MLCVDLQSAIEVYFTFSIDKFLKNHDNTFCHYTEEMKDREFKKKNNSSVLFSKL